MTKQPKTATGLGTFADAKSFFQHQDSDADFLKIDGFVEKSKQSGNVRVAPNGDCQGWIEIPERSIRAIEVLNEHATCVTPEDGYHTHPYVRVSLDHGDPLMAKALGRLVRQLLQKNLARVGKGIAADSPRPGLRYFGRAAGSGRTSSDNCKAGYRCIYVGTDQCDYGCACVDEDGMGYCSTCCIA